MLVRAYLRASTTEQDAQRARADLQAFCRDRGLRVAGWYIENESGATLKRPELARLLNDCEAGDVLLVEQVDRLSRLNAQDWDRLRSELKAKRVCVVALDLPTSWQAIATDDEFTQPMAEAINGMLLDMLAAIARKDFDDRRRRQSQGIAKARAEGRLRGRQEDAERNASIMRLLRAGESWSNIVKTMSCSRATVAKLAKRSPIGAVQSADNR